MIGQDPLRMMSSIGKIILSSMFIMVFSGTLKSQYGSFGLTDARQLGMGNTYATNSRGLYAAGKNPSLLAERISDRKLDILFPNLSARAYNITKVTNYFNDMFSQRPVDIITSIDGSVIKRALENGGSLSLGLQIGYLSAGYTHSENVGSFSFAMKDYLSAYFKVPQMMVDFHDGENFSRSFVFRDLNIQSSWTRAYELSYGRVFKTNPSSGILSIYAGIGVKYISGFMYRDVEFSSGVGYQEEDGTLVGTYLASSKSAFSDDIDFGNIFSEDPVVSHVPFMHSVGKGAAFDLGLTLLLDPGVKVGVSLTDLGFIDWNGKTKSTLVSGVIRLDSTLDISDLDSLANLIVIEKETDDSFRTHPSGAVHIGTSFMIHRFVHNFPGTMNVTLEMHQGLNRTVQNPAFMRVALGFDWKPGRWWPVFLAGMTTSQVGSLDWSLGIGYQLNFMELYIASPDFSSVVQGKDLETLSLSICWHFVRGKKKGDLTGDL